MILSMTGFGESHSQQDGLAVAVEIRTINNRFFKLTVRASEGYASLEPLVESEVREAIHRGTIQVNVRVDRTRSHLEIAFRSTRRTVRAMQYQ